MNSTFHVYSNKYAKEVVLSIVSTEGMQSMAVLPSQAIEIADKMKEAAIECVKDGDGQQHLVSYGENNE